MGNSNLGTGKHGLTVKTADGTYMFNSEKERDSWLRQKEESDKKEDEQYTQAIQQASSPVDRQLLIWARGCMRQLKREGANPSTIQDVLTRLQTLLADNNMADAKKSKQALQPTSLLNKQLGRISDILEESRWKNDHSYGLHWINGVKQSNEYDEDFSADALWHNIDLPRLAVGCLSVHGGAAISSLYKEYPTMSSVLIKKVMNSLERQLSHSKKEKSIDSLYNIFVYSAQGETDFLLPSLRQFCENHPIIRNNCLEYCIKEMEDPTTLPCIIDSFPQKTLRSITPDIKFLEPSPHDSTEMEVAKRAALRQLAMKGYPEAQEKMIVCYAKEGNLIQAEAMARRLSNNKFAQENKKTEALDAANHLKKKLPTLSTLGQTLSAVGGVNTRGQTKDQHSAPLQTRELERR